MATSGSNRKARFWEGTSRNTSGRTSRRCVIAVHEAPAEITATKIVTIDVGVFLSLRLNKSVAAEAAVSLRHLVHLGDGLVERGSVKSIMPRDCQLVPAIIETRQHLCQRNA